MAKKLAAGEKSKQEIVMEFLQSHTDLTAKEVQEALANRGTEVSIPTIHAAKQKAGLVKPRGEAKPAQAPASKQLAFPPAPVAPASNGEARTVALERFTAIIGRAQDFVKECGSFSAAVEVLKTLEGAGMK